MKKISLSLYLGYAVSCVTFVCGVVVVAGLVPMRHMSVQLRSMFGIVLILWGIFRFAATQTQRRQRDMEDAEE
jgi:Ca2+/H+ antiporter